MARRRAGDGISFTLHVAANEALDTPLRRQADPIFVFTLLTLGFSVVGGVLQMLNRSLAELDAPYLTAVLAHVTGNLVSSLTVIALLLLAWRSRGAGARRDWRLPYLLVAAGGLLGGVVRLPIEAAFTGPLGVRSLPWSVLAEGAWFLVAGLITRIVNRLARGELEARERLLAAIEREQSTRSAMLQADVSLRRDIAEWAHGRLQGELLSAALSARRLGPEGASIADRLDALRDEELRPLAQSLHPAMAEVDLRSALQQLALRHGPDRRVSVTLSDGAAADEASNRRRLQQLALPIYRIVEEGVANAIRHGDAHEIHVDVRLHPEAVELHVRNNGHGATAPLEPGLGSGIIDSWVRSVDGEWRLSFPPRGGADLQVRLPIPTALD